MWTMLQTHSLPWLFLVTSVFAGNAEEDIVSFKPENCFQDFIIMVPQSEEWAELIVKNYGDRAKPATRYAIKKEQNIFDKDF